MPGLMGGGGHGPQGRNVNKSKNFKKTLKRLMRGFKPLLPQFIFVAVILIGAAVLSVVTPIILRNTLTTESLASIISVSSTGTTIVNWGQLCAKFGLMLGLYFASAFFLWISDWIIVKISADYAYNTRETVKNKLDKLPLKYFDNHTYGQILSRGTNDVDTISQSMQQIISQAVYGIALLIAVIVAMFCVSWELALIAIAILPFTVLVTVIIAVKSQKQFLKYRVELSNLNGNVEENFSGYKIVKLFNMDEKKTQEFEIINESMTKADRWSQFLSSLIFPSMRFISNIGFVAVCVVGGLISTTDADSIANLAAFFLFLNLFQQPFQQIGQISSVVQSTVAAAERIYTLLDEAEEIPNKDGCINNEDQIEGQIDFDHVNFSYSEEKKLIEDFNLHIKKGDSVAIVGPTGAGKTTIVNLLMRFYDVNSGKIVLDSYDTRDYSREALRGSVGMVLQETWLYNGTIRENIRYGRSDAADEEIIEAAKAARADHFIKTLPGGYDFVLNEDGTNISQGQRQLITIARAIISQPKILILDEATSSVDTRTEVEIQEVMNKMMEGRTSFIIAHRLSTIKGAKMIIVMNKGKIVESGNHKELLEQNGFYADLYNAQFSGRNPIAEVEQETES